MIWMGTDEQALQSIITELKSKYDQPLFFLLDDRFTQLIEVLTRNQFRMIRKTEIIHIDPTQKKSKCSKMNEFNQSERYVIE